MADRTTLFLCRCGTNVADFVDLEALQKWALQSADVDHVSIHDFLCAPAGKEFIEATLKEHGSVRAVMAACPGARVVASSAGVRAKKPSCT